MTSPSLAVKAPTSSSWTTSVHLSTTAHVTQNAHYLLIFLSAPLNCELPWGEGICIIWLPIISVVFGTQKDLSKVGWTELNEILHCLAGGQKCYELCGATRMVLKNVMGCLAPSAEVQITWNWCTWGYRCCSLQQLCSQGLLSLQKRLMTTVDRKYEHYLMT